MEITANLLKLHDEWIVAQVEAVEGDTLPGDPDIWLVQPHVVDCEGQLTPWATHSSETEFNVRSSDITIVTNPSKAILARYIECIE
jgi:hypothetical protein|tara:strand:- start:404 stop:661 length:258 start_codon:yes stop_codon:yes gene_type:complete